MSAADDAWQASLAFASPQTVTKIQRLATGGHTSLAFILDWDGVVTDKDADGMVGTSWDIFRRHMTPANQRKHREIYASYRPFEKAGSLTVADAERWQREAMELLIGVSARDIELDALHHVKLRPGMKQFFDICQTAGLPVFINSTAECGIISAVANHFDIHPAKIFSNQFIVKDGIIRGIHEQSLTHPLNKHNHSHRSLNGHEGRTTTILVGDNLHDAHMIVIDDTTSTLRLRMDCGHASYIADHSEAEWQHYLQDSFEAGYDMVATDDNTDSLLYLVELFGTA
jgi:phosphoserine phosphatase